MNRKYTLILILILTLLLSIIIVFLTKGRRLKTYIINEQNLNNIISNRKESNSIKINKITFNDYNLIIDENNNKIYYSIVNSLNKNNPVINYKTNIKTKLIISNNKIMIYNKDYYHIYKLIYTEYPTINFIYNDKEHNKKIINTDIEIFDNNNNSPKRVIKSLGNLIFINDNEYKFSLLVESAGRNKRDNNMSIFGMDKHNEYVLRKDNRNNNKNYIEVFINNEYKGKYILEKERR